jgi:hypothetical protein
MTFNHRSLASPTHMGFISSASPAGLTTAQAMAEQTLAGMISTQFVNDFVSIFNAVDASGIRSGLSTVKTELQNGISISDLQNVISAGVGDLKYLQVKAHYDYTAGKDLASLITKDDVSALYTILPTGTISKSDLNTDISMLKTDLKTGNVNGFEHILKGL